MKRGAFSCVVSQYAAISLLVVSYLVTGCSDRIVQNSLAEDNPGEQELIVLPTDVAKVIIGDTSTHQPHYMRDISGEVVKIEVGHGFVLPQQIPIEPYAVIQVSQVPEALLERLAPIVPSGEQGVTFSGVLSEQFYLNHDDQLVLHALIICNDNTVIVSTNGSVVRVENEYRYVPPTNHVAQVALRSPGYVKNIYLLMKYYAPEQISKRKDFYNNIGIDLEAQLFGKQDHLEEEK